MNGLTERLCHSLSAIPEPEVSAQGARLVHDVWSRFPASARNDFPIASAAAPAGLSATGSPAKQLPVEIAAFNNAFQFALKHREGQTSREGVTAERVCWSVPVFGATALAEARAADCRRLSYAVGLGIEAHSRLIASLASSSARKGFDPDIVAATLAAIVACGTIKGFAPHELAQALGLGCSAITAATAGYLPLQAAMAARDGIVMVLLVTCGLRAPPDALACRWGIYETFGDATNAGLLDLRPHRVMSDGALQRLLGSCPEGNHGLHGLDGSIPVQNFMADVFRS